MKYILNDIEGKRLFYDSKTVLQEMLQKDGHSMSYVLVSEEGPDHDKLYTVNMIVDDKVMGTGIGSSKKHAEQKAAYETLKKLGKV